MNWLLFQPGTDILYLQTTKAFLPGMIASKRGHIVTIASMAGTVGMTKLVDYCASKFAALGFDESLRIELETHGHTDIHTTSICPYFIKSTGMFDGVDTRSVSFQLRIFLLYIFWFRSRFVVKILSFVQLHTIQIFEVVHRHILTVLYTCLPS